MLDVLGEAACRTLLLATVVQLGLGVLRIRRAQLLLITWTVVLAASLAMPALQWAMPVWAMPVRWPIVPGDLAAWLAGAADPPEQAVLPVPGPALGTGLPTLGTCLEAVYLAVGSLLLLRLAVGITLSRRLLCQATPMWPEVAPGADVRISRAVGAPVTVGNIILLPSDAAGWPTAMRQAVIAHEHAHVARRDFAVLLLSQLNRALFWFSPVPWLLHRHLAALAELASDDHAMQVTGDRTGYAEILLAMARRSGPLLRGLAMARASTLRYRIERVLSGPVAASPASGFQRAMIIVGATVVSVVAASPDFELNGPRPSMPGERPRPGPAVWNEPAYSNPAAAGASRQPPPSPVEQPSRSPSRSAPSQPAQAAPLQPVNVQAAARTTPRPMASSTHAAPARTAPLRNRAGEANDAAAPVGGKAAGRSRAASGVIGIASHSNAPANAGEPDDEPAAPRNRRVGEPTLLNAIDQQSCNGLYLPGPDGGPHHGGWLDVVRAKFFRQADGRPYLTLDFGMRDPVSIPVTVTGREVAFTAANNVTFKVTPQGANHLTGTTQSPYGTIDVACGRPGAHLFDRNS